MKPLAVVILAAGQGTRMKSDLAKVLHPLLGRPMLAYPLGAARALKPQRTVVVIGVQGDQVRRSFQGDRTLRFAVQKKQKGTAHAVMAAMPSLRGFRGDVLVLYGDTPLITAASLKLLVGAHRRTKAAVSLLTARVEEPFGYGRIIRDHSGRVERIIEEKDCSAREKKIKEINPGFYCYDLGFLKKALPGVGNRNRQKEYYLTDLLEIAVEGGSKVASVLADDPDEIIGVNSRADMAMVGGLLRERINRAHCLAGVTVEDPATTWIEGAVRIGKDTVIEPGARLSGSTVIGAGCVIEMNARIEDSVIGRGVRIKTGSVIEESEVKTGAQVGPMAHLRPGSVIGKDARIGNYVETKKARVGDGSKISHLTYVGDAEVGKNVNIGCGFITCNYDGEKKHLTVIEDDVFVGSDTQTVAPVRIGRGAYIGSGSTITEDVPPGSLALTRPDLVVKKGWAAKKRSVKKTGKKPAKKKVQRRKK